MKLPHSYYNSTSFIGAILASLSLLIILFLVILSFLFTESNNYLGLFIYIIMPIFLVLGLLLIPFGMLLSKRRRNKGIDKQDKTKWPIIDLNNKRYRNAILIFGLGSIIFLFATGIGSYEAFHYTESVNFCGTMCHQVMEPQYTTFQNSPHARIKCVDCHVGTGANWYVKSKLSGLKQVYAVAINDYPTPIPTPLSDLRPARETCEQCHWPEKFYSHQLRYFKHFLSDSLNTEWNIGLKMKIGPSHPSQKFTEGIHWHINPDIKVEYISKRGKRKTIPWVRYINLVSGDTILYEDAKRPLKAKKLADAVPREMDCMDCHNRPSHQYASPSLFVDMAISSNEISKDLPFIKHHAMQLFVDPYDDTQTALSSIDIYMDSVYANHVNATDVRMAKQSLKKHYAQNIFAEMGASWDAYPNHIGHKTFKGCFRCHDNQHVSKEGKTISMDCNLCHHLVSQGKEGNVEYASMDEYLTFTHPIPINFDFSKDQCTDCHRYLY